MKDTVTRFAIENNGKYLSLFSESTWGDIWNATLWKSKPNWYGHGKIVMVNVSYEQLPYEVKDD